MTKKLNGKASGINSSRGFLLELMETDIGYKLWKEKESPIIIREGFHLFMNTERR